MSIQKIFRAPALAAEEMDDAHAVDVSLQEDIGSRDGGAIAAGKLREELRKSFWMQSRLASIQTLVRVANVIAEKPVYANEGTSQIGIRSVRFKESEPGSE